ncbi:small integral membrane protein 29 isoform X1 [Gorilla gorilla gorilla]|nr:small integral membrane protein 29 isoform X1 [Gorilla gorilla gorilla]
MYRRKSGWTGCAITCSPCTAMTQLRNCMRLSRSCSLTWETPRWYMAGRVATSTSGCRCWMSRRDLTPLPHPSEPGVLDCLGPCRLLPLLSPGSPCWVLGLHFSLHPPSAASASHALTITSLPPGLLPFVGVELTAHPQALMGRGFPSGMGAAGRHLCFL